MKQKASKFLLVLSCATMLSGCNADGYFDWSEAKKVDPIDRDANLTREDFQNLRDVNSLKKAGDDSSVSTKVGEPPIPELAEILAAPPKPKIGETQLVSLAVTDDVPLKDVLLEVARLAKIDIDVDSTISGGVSMRATDKPFNEVIERICDMAGLRYSMKNGVLRIERDTPYVKVYTLDLLNSERSASGSINVGSSSIAGGSSSSSGSSSSGSSSSSSGSSSSGTSGTSSTGTGSSSSPASSSSSGGDTGGSSASITARAESDFWSKFEESIKKILAYTPANTTSAVAKQAPQSASDNSASTTGQAQATVASALGVDSSAAASSSDSSSNDGNKTFYTINREASTLTVSGTERQHTLIQKFLDKIQTNTSSQVLIEAKVIEVDLSDSYQSGINWRKFGGNQLSFSGNLNGVTPSATSLTAPSLNVLKSGFINKGVDLSTAVSLLNEFGTTRALSSPRINATNNQQAVLRFSEEIRYFQVKIDITDPVKDAQGVIVTSSKFSINSDPKSAPIGIVLNLQPSINSDTQEVTINIRPTITRLVKFVPDPAFEVSKANAIAKLAESGAPQSSIDALSSTHSEFPQLETRELDSIVKVKSGQTLVIGGLLEDKINNTDSGIPYASEIPILGNMFKSVTKTTSKKELVIFLRATIIGNGRSADSYDKAVYEKFIQDPRPLKF